jgi:hypothetical protein
MTTVVPTRPVQPSPVAPPADAGSGERRRLRAPGLDTLFTLVFGLAGWGIGLARLSDNSFFWHLRTGHLILDEGIPHSDPFSFTAPGVKWVAQSWLAEAVYGGLDRLAGPFAIRMLGGVLAASIAVLTFRLALRLTHDRIRAALLAIAALVCLFTLWAQRPLILGVLLLVLVLWTVEVPDSVLGRHPLVVLPVLFWLWANVHGSFALGFAYLGLHLLGRWLDGARPWQGRERTLLVGTVIGFVATFANPYGLALVTFPVDLLRRGDLLSHVVEWGSPSFHRLQGYAFAVWIVTFAVVIARGSHRVPRRDLVVAIPFLLLGFWALRNVAIAPLVCLPIAARAVAVAPDRTPETRPRIGWVVAAALAFMVALVGFGAADTPDFAFGSYPVRAMRAVEHQGLLGRKLLTDDADAGYVILRYSPDQRVFMDDRYDMFPRAVIEDFFLLNDGSRGWDRVLERYDVEVVVWGTKEPLTQLLRQDDGWDVTYRDAHHTVFVRSGVTAD